MEVFLRYPFKYTSECCIHDELFLQSHTHAHTRARYVLLNLSSYVQRRRRLRKLGSNIPFSVRKELRDGNLHSLLGGGSSLPVSSLQTEPDPLLTSFIYNPPVDDEPSSDQPLSSVEGCSFTTDDSFEDAADRYDEFHRNGSNSSIFLANLFLFTAGRLLKSAFCPTKI